MHAPINPLIPAADAATADNDPRVPWLVNTRETLAPRSTVDRRRTRPTARSGAPRAGPGAAVFCHSQSDTTRARSITTGPSDDAGEGQETNPGSGRTRPDYRAPGNPGGAVA